MISILPLGEATNCLSSTRSDSLVSIVPTEPGLPGILHRHTHQQKDGLFSEIEVSHRRKHRPLPDC